MSTTRVTPAGVKSSYRRRLFAGVGGGALVGGLTAALRGRGERHKQLEQRRKQNASTGPPLALAATAKATKAPASSSSIRGGAAGLAMPVGPGSAVSVEELGNATWTLLHTMGAQYPEYPTRRQRRAARHLIRSLEHIYPCHACAKHWSEVLASVGPPRVRSGQELRQWLCDAHNVVNPTVGKAKVDCATLQWRLVGETGAECGDVCKVR